MYLFAMGALPMALLSMMYLAQRREAAVWNGGVCKETGEPWRLFDRDSQGGRGYRSGPRTMWISYPWIDGAR